MGDRWLSLAEAAKRVHRGASTIRRWAADGDLRVFDGRVRESHVLAVDKAKRSNRRGRAAVVIPLVTQDGEQVGHLRIAESGEITGKLDTPTN